MCVGNGKVKITVRSMAFHCVTPHQPYTRHTNPLHVVVTLPGSCGRPLAVRGFYCTCSCDPPPEVAVSWACSQLAARQHNNMGRKHETDVQVVLEDSDAPTSNSAFAALVRNLQRSRLTMAPHAATAAPQRLLCRLLSMHHNYPSHCSGMIPNCIPGTDWLALYCLPCIPLFRGQRCCSAAIRPQRPSTAGSASRLWHPCQDSWPGAILEAAALGGRQAN